MNKKNIDINLFNKIHFNTNYCCVQLLVIFNYVVLKYIYFYSLQEPIETWRDLNGHNLLHLTYSDPQRWNFAFQHNVQLSRLNLQSKTTNKDVQMFERSLQNNR